MSNGSSGGSIDPDQTLFGYAPSKGPGYPVRLDPRLCSVHEQIDGLIFPDLIARWAQWVYVIGPSENAAVDYEGDKTELNQPGDINVFFLAGTFGGTAKRECKAKKGKHIFFSIISDVYTQAELPARLTPDSDLLSLAQSEVDTVKGMSLTLDGTVFYQYDLVYYRCQSRFDITFPESGILPGTRPGTTVKAVADGYWILIKSSYLDTLDKHVIHFFATADDGYTQDVTYTLNMVAS